MKCSNRLFVYFISLVHLITGLKIVQSDETTVIEFLKSLNNKSIEITSKLVDAQWEFETQNSGNAKQELFQATSDAIKNANINFRTVLTNYPWKSYLDPEIRRQLKYYSEIGMLALPEEKYQQEIMSELEVIQQNTTICDYYNRTKCDLHLHPEIQEKLETSLNLGEISYLWTEWKKLTEPKYMNLLDKYVNLSNQAAVFNNYKNYKEYSLRNIEVDTPKQEMENLWETLKPLYEQIHAYVRRKLRNIYGEKIVSEDGAIPSQLLGDVWGENWARIANRLMPFPEEDDTNFTEIMINLNYTPESVRKLAENYYTSMDFTVPDKLWYDKTSEEHLEGVCHPKIFNFYKNDVRIKDCGRMSFNDYLEDIRLLAKAEYMIQYSQQPFIYQTPADPGLETAVIDVLTLSASTFNNLKRLGLYKEEVTDKVRINRLFKIALEKITVIPFLLVQEFWRWDVFDGKPIEDTLNALNELRWTFQGISTPTKEFNFNPGGVGSVFSRISLAHNFIAYFFEFQLYEFFCSTSESPEKDECDFFKNVKVGDALRYIMKSGSSKSFREIKSNLLGQHKIKAESILNYFKPLMNWLKMENYKAKEFIGWKRDTENKDSPKVRRKKSVDYLTDDVDDDTTSNKERNRFQRFIYKRSENNLDESKESERKRKSAANEKENERKAKDGQQKQVRSSEETASQSSYTKKRRSKNNELNDFKQPTPDQENSSSSNKYSSKNVKRQLDSDSFKSEIYSNFLDQGNDNSQLLNSYDSRISKCGANCDSYNGPYENLRSYAITPEKGGTEDEALSEFFSRNKKRQLDTEFFDPYLKVNENFQSTQNHSSRNAKLPSDSQPLGQPHDSSSVYGRTRDEEENNQMLNKHGLRNGKRHSDSESLNSQQIYNQYAPKKTNHRSDWETLKQFNDNLQSYNREKDNENNVRGSKYSALNAKRQMSSFDEFNNGANIHSNPLNIKEKNAYQKRSNGVVKKNYENSDKESNNVEIGNANKIRYARKVWKNQRQYTDEENMPGQSLQISRRKEKMQNPNERLSRNVKWHTDTKKDISRLLHSIGLSVENDEKDKVKELKKKLKGDSNSELKGPVFSKENVLENMLDFDKIKSGIGKSDAEEEKEANKFWALKTYLADNAKIIQSSPNLNKKEGMLNTLLSNSFFSKASDEKSVGKKDTSVNGELSLIPGNQNMNSEIHFSQNGDNNGARRMGISAASLQAILQKADLNNYGQKQMYSGKPELMENKMKNEITPQNHGVKGNANQFSVLSYKYPSTDGLQFKKEFRETPDVGTNKSPYIIIVGQLTPEMREKLLHDKSNSFMNLEKPLFQTAPDVGEKKQPDKRSQESDQIYIVPIDLKNSQLNLLKPNLYTEHEHEAGHDLNTERDQESEQEQLRLEDNSKIEDKSNFYKTGKESPSEFIISWNNDKNRKIVKRSKRDHDKEINDNKFKLLGLAPVKASFLENILGKSVDQASLDDKNVQMLIQDALLNGNSEQTPTANGESPESVGMPADQPQINSVQSTPSLSSLASSVISALSPKGYSQASKASSQRQDSDIEEDSTKDASAPQAFIREGKDELPFVFNSGVRCNTMGGKKKLARIYANEEARKLANPDFSALDDSSCKKIVLTTCPSKNTNQGACPCPCPCPCPLPCPIPTPCATPLPYPSPSLPQEDGKCSVCISPSASPSSSSSSDICCKKPSECSLVNCQFKITKAKKPHERLTIMIYDRINPPAELPEPYDSLAVISEILQRIQSCSGKQGSQLTEEDPDYPANDNMDQLKGGETMGQDNKNKIQELNGEMPVTANENGEEEEMDDGNQNAQQAASSSDEEKYQPREKATPAIDQLTVFNKDKLKPVFIELRKIDDILKKRSQEGQ